MRHVTFVVPGSLDTRTGGYIYDARIVGGLRERGWRVDVREVDDSFPHPGDGVLQHAHTVFHRLQDRSIVLVDGLAYGAMPDLVARHAGRLRFVPIVHLPLALDPSLAPAAASALEQSERRALAAARHVIATGAATVPTLTRYGVTAARLSVVPPGTDPQEAHQREASPVVQLLCVATVNAGKGHALLLSALAAVPHRNWHLTCVGSLTRDPAVALDVQSLVGELGLETQVTLTGEPSEQALAEHYGRADLFVLATLRETFGMAAAEALAHGLPVISTDTGAIAEMVGIDAGIVVPPGDEAALTAALTRVLGDARLRERMAAAALDAARRLPTWAQAFDRVDHILRHHV